MAQQKLNAQFPFGSGQEVLPSLRALMLVLENRFENLEAPQRTADDAISDLEAYALSRINSLLIPELEKAANIINTGAQFETTSASQVLVTPGMTTFQLPTEDWGVFVSTGYLTAISMIDSSVTMNGTSAGFDRTTGKLTINVEVVRGKGLFEGWRILPGLPVMFPGIIDPGFYDDPNNTGFITPVQVIGDGQNGTAVGCYDNPQDQITGGVLQSIGVY